MDLQNQLILTLVLMFVVLYIFFNMDNIRNGDVFSDGSEYKKPLIISLIGALIVYLFLTWDSDDEYVPSYSIGNNRVSMNRMNVLDRLNLMDSYNSEPQIFLSSRFGNVY
jgi:hypothetical protein